MRMLDFMPASIAQRRHTVRKGLREFENIETFARKNGIPIYVQKGKLFLGCEALDEWERKPSAPSRPFALTTQTPPVMKSPPAFKVYRNPLDAGRNYVVDTREITVTPAFPCYPTFPGPNGFEDDEFGF
jgi:hypothetical protein